MDFWSAFNWLWGGTNCSSIVWPDWIQWAFVIGVGFAEFIAYRLFVAWVEKNYGSFGAFWYFTVRPAIEKIEPNSPEDLRLLTVKERYLRIRQAKHIAKP